MSTVDTIKAARAAMLAAARAYDLAVNAGMEAGPERRALFRAMLGAREPYYRACEQWEPADGLVTGCGIHPCIPNPFCPNCWAHEDESAATAAGEAAVR